MVDRTLHGEIYTPSRVEELRRTVGVRGESEYRLSGGPDSPDRIQLDAVSTEKDTHQEGQQVGTAVVTGAASGIGKACAVVLHQAGYDLLLIDVKALALSDLADGLGCSYQVVDLGRDSPIVETPPSVVVCSHGISAAGKTWNEVIEVNLNGAWRTIEACLPMKDAAIVLIGSMTGHIVGNYGFTGIASYAASKAGLVGMTRQLAVELAEQNVRVNCVLPGPVETPMTDAFRERNPFLYEEFFHRVPLEGKTQPMDIAQAVLYLVRAKRVTGQTLIVDGGYVVG